MEITMGNLIAIIGLLLTLLLNGGGLIYFAGRMVSRMESLEKIVTNGISHKIDLIDERTEEHGKSIARIEGSLGIKGD